MERTKTVERLFTLGDYQNIKFTDSVSGIPGKSLIVPELDRALTAIQLSSIQLSYFEYANLMKQVKGANIEDAIEFLNNNLIERSITFKELVENLK